MPKFWKLSQGPDYFSVSDIIESIEQRLVFIGKDTHALGRSNTSQVEEFINADIGDYFYLTHGTSGIYLLGQFTGPANYISERDGWIDRPFRLIKPSNDTSKINGSDKWWMPNHNSTFCVVKEDELNDFENLILTPYFELSLSDFNL